MPKIVSDKKSLHEITCIADVLRILGDNSKGLFIYRGEDSTKYALKPKLGRYSFAEFLNWPDAENNLLENFKRKSIPYLTTRLRSEMQWLALAQHHGLATRLLDWTENPLVELYFAISIVTLIKIASFMHYIQANLIILMTLKIPLVSVKLPFTNQCMRLLG